MCKYKKMAIFVNKIIYNVEIDFRFAIGER